MILKASQRAGGTQLAMHLLRTDENEHVHIHEIKGFISDDPIGAFKEAQAISRGTKCKQFLFSLSLSPPEREGVPIETFEQAIAEIEERIGLAGQPRVIVFHEKEGRRHAHCVWSRIKIETMTAINLPHFKMKLRDISRQLYIENNWQMPRGLMNSEERDPLNFTIAEWQQAKRLQKDPRTIKQMFQDCWAVSDSQQAFSSALEERGYYLAKGDRRGFVALDWRGEVFAISRCVDVRAKEVNARLGSPDELPTVEVIRKMLAERFTDKLQKFSDEAEARQAKAISEFETKRQILVDQHRQSRTALASTQQERWIAETKIRSARLPTGFKALWFRITGKYRMLKRQNEVEAQDWKRRDRQESQSLIDKQLRERRQLQHEKRLLRHRHDVLGKRLDREISTYLQLVPDELSHALNKRNHALECKRTRRRRLEPSG